MPLFLNICKHLQTYNYYSIADPITKTFLTDHKDEVFGFPQLVRFSWSTAESIIMNSSYDVEWQIIKEASIKNSSITSFFKMNNKSEKHKHKFFLERNLFSDSVF